MCEKCESVEMRAWNGVCGGCYYLVQTMDQFWKFYAELKKQTLIVIDTETNGLRICKDMPCGLVFGWGVENNYYLPIDHKTDCKQLNINDIREPLQDVLSDDAVLKIFWNEKFDRHMLSQIDISVKSPRRDGVIAVHLVDENEDKSLKKMAEKFIDPNAATWEKRLGLWRTSEAKRRRSELSKLIKEKAKDYKSEEYVKFCNDNISPLSGLTSHQLALLYLNHIKDLFKDHFLTKNKKTDITYDYVPLDIIAPYACADTHYTFLLFKENFYKVTQREDLLLLFENESKLLSILYDVEKYGVCVDIPYLKELSEILRREILLLCDKIEKAVGYSFDIDSPLQLVNALLHVGCKLTKLTDSGQKVNDAKMLQPCHYSTDVDALTELAQKYSFANDVITYRNLQKLLNTYAIALQKHADSRHHVHTQFNPNVRTGRMSSSSPNLQNIPARDDRIRKCVIVSETMSDYVFVFMDYSQIELRLTAHHSKDERLLAAYPWNGAGLDVHSITAAEAVLGVSVGDFLTVYSNTDHPKHKEYKWARNVGKRVNFGIIYGISEIGLQRQISTSDHFVSVDDCSRYIQKYLDSYPGVATWIKKTIFLLSRYGYLQNSFGRFRKLPNARSKERWMRERAGRQGVNFKVQSDAADLFKHAVVRVDSFLRKEKAHTKMVNFVHDEVQFYWHKKEFSLLKEVKKLMEDFPQFDVPIVVDIEYSERDWAAKKMLA